MNNLNQITKETFLKDVSKHQLTILNDDGIYRHIRMSNPQSSDADYDIVTYPGYLVYSGDMGCFVFSRVKDMFAFFRNDSDDWRVNTGYWAEKLEAVDRADNYKEFSFDRFTENLMDYCESNEQKEWMKSELQWVEEDEFGAVEFIRNFDNNNDASVDLTDFWECRNDVESSRYLWCCHALVWAIRQYDLVKAEGVAA